MSRAEAALRYARYGWPVFPVRRPADRCPDPDDCRCKAPLTEHGLQEATTDEREISRWWRRWPQANVAIATGAPGPDVLDVDNHGKNANGFAAFNWLRRAGLAPDGMGVIRTPGGGFHVVYRGTGQRNGSLPRHHIDYRSAGGYVVAPPSVVHGRPYEVVVRRPSQATADFGAIRALLDPPQARPQRQPEPRPAGDGGRTRSVAHLAGWVAALREGNRNAGLFWAASRAVEAGDMQTLESLAEAARAVGLDPREAERAIRSAQRAGADRPFVVREREAG